jgi:four helix bundle protein
MKYENLKRRTKKFGLDVIQLVEKLPSDQVTKVLSNQLLRAGTSVGANYRSACRAKSPADFISKLGFVEEEADESGYWLEMLVDAGKVASKTVSPLIQESAELTAIAVASINTARHSGTRAVDTRRGQLPRPSSTFRTPHSALRT